MLRSEQINEIAEALATAQGDIENPKRNRTVRVRTRSGETYEFSYATLDAVIEAIKKPFAKNGIGYTQTLSKANERYTLKTTLLHKSGQWIASETPLLVEEAGNQKFGSALTFMRRYALAALVGVASEEDDDANAADGNEAQVRERKTTPKAPSPMPEPPKPTELKEKNPHEIPIILTPGGREDWILWGQTYLTALQGSSDQSQLEDWIVANKNVTTKMETAAPKVFKRLSDAVFNLHQEMSGGAGG